MLPNTFPDKDVGEITPEQIAENFNQLSSPEGWHEVGAGRAINDPDFQNSWVNFDANHNSCAFRGTPDGTVYLRGFVSSGLGSPSVIYQLPPGYRPERTEVFGVISNSLFGHVTVEPNGEVTARAPFSNVSLSLDGIAFRRYESYNQV